MNSRRRLRQRVALFRPTVSCHAGLGCLDNSRVIYLETFSKVLAPSLRLGYIVAPDCLAESFVGARALMGRGSPLTEQLEEAFQAPPSGCSLIAE